MNYSDFTKRKAAFDGFVKMRKKVLDGIDKGSADAFFDVCAQAMDGDCVAQDVAAYFFNHGISGFLAPNYTAYLSWQILAGANGNEFALEKLEFFLNSALETILNDEQLLVRAMTRKNITKDNALMVIANLICEGIVDEMKIDPKNLVKNNTPQPYTAAQTRPFEIAMEKCLPAVIRFLIS